MDDDRRPRRALALHFAPEEIRGILSRDPRFEWAFASAPGEVLPALEAHRPEVVFSLKQSRLPGASSCARDPRPGGEVVPRRRIRSRSRGVASPTGPAPDQRTRVLAPFIAERAMAGLLHLVTGMDAMQAAAARDAGPPRDSARWPGGACSWSVRGRREPPSRRRIRPSDAA